MAPNPDLVANKKLVAGSEKEAEFLRQWYDGSAPGTAGFRFRHREKMHFKERIATHAAAVQRMEAGATDARTLRHVARGVGGGHAEGAWQRTPEESVVAGAVFRRLNDIRTQVMYLIYQIEHLRGCSSDRCTLSEGIVQQSSTMTAASAMLLSSTEAAASSSCAAAASSSIMTASSSARGRVTDTAYVPLYLDGVRMKLILDAVDSLAPRDCELCDIVVTGVWLDALLRSVSAPSASLVPMCLLNWDHEDGVVKVGIMSDLNPAQREEERPKCKCKCMVCHLMHTRQQLRYAASAQQAIKNGNSYQQLACMKSNTGCQFPSHEHMPWASQLDEFRQLDGKLLPAALHVSHHRRGGTHGKLTPTVRHASHRKDLSARTASVFCLFCDSAWTAMERIRMYPCTPMSLHQLPVLQAYCTEFVKEFDVLTADVDWEGVDTLNMHSS